MTRPRTPRRRPRLTDPGPRGYPVRGGGAATLVPQLARARGTSVQLCGLWPFATGAAVPTIGVPLGPRLPTPGAPGGEAVSGDPHSWFTRAGLIRAPSAFVLGLNGLGKSTLARRWCVGWEDMGVHPLVLGDLKPDYVATVLALGGQHVPIGRHRGYLNPLDIRYAQAAAARLTGTARTQLLADARARRAALLFALLTILRRASPDEREEVICTRALRVLDDHWPLAPWAPGTTPVAADLLRVLREGPPDVRAVAVAGRSEEAYRAAVHHLEATLVALIDGDRLGGLFAQPTSDAAAGLDLDRPVALDISSIGDGEDDLAAAALLACWSYGFGLIDAANALADARVEPQRYYAVLMDELWRPLRVGHGIPDRIDGVTRLDRNKGVTQVQITHTMSDLDLPDPADAAKARGFVERAGMLALLGLPPAEMEKLDRVVRLTEPERRMVTGWTTPGSWNPATGRAAPPPGLGKVLLKVGTEAPGTPVQVQLTAAELAWNDTNHRWHAAQGVPAGGVG